LDLIKLLIHYINKQLGSKKPNTYQLGKALGLEIQVHLEFWKSRII